MTSASIQESAEGAASDPLHFSVTQYRVLARQGLLLPLLKAQVIAKAVSEVSLSQDEKKRTLQEWAQRLGLKSEEQFKSHLQQQLLSVEDACFQAELPLRIDRHVLENFTHRAEKRFLERKAELDRVVYSLIRVKDMGLAQELYLRIAEEEDTFADLAAAYSQGDEKARNGIVGPAPLNQSHPTITERLRSAQPKQLFPPFFINPWWIVLRLEDLQAAVFNDEMRLLMARDLFNEWVNEELHIQLKELQRLLEPAAV